MQIELISKRVLLFIPVVALVIFATGAVAQEEENVSVRVNAPEFVSGTFEVTIDIHNVVDLTSGNFELYFDPDVVTVLDVEPSGRIDDTEFKVQWNVVDDMVIVIFDLEASLVSGSGYLATIKFEVVGNDGDTSALELSEGDLVSFIHYYYQTSTSTEIVGINADWSGDVVTVGNTDMIGAAATSETPVQTATPRPSSLLLDSGAGSVAASTPATEHASDAAVPAGTSERDEPDGWGALAEHNFIGTYLFIGLLAFAYTLIVLR